MTRNSRNVTLMYRENIFDMSRSFRKHIFSKYWNDPSCSFKDCKIMIHRLNRRRCKRSLRCDEEPLPDIPFSWIDRDCCKIYQGSYPKGHKFYKKHIFPRDFQNQLKRK